MNVMLYKTIKHIHIILIIQCVTIQGFIEIIILKFNENVSVKCLSNSEDKNMYFDIFVNIRKEKMDGMTSTHERIKNYHILALNPEG
jgi:hypothetical protein